MNRGGAETLIMNLYRNIDRSRVQFDFLTCKEGVFDEEIKSFGGKIYRIPYVTDVGHIGYVQALSDFFRSNSHYKIIHSHMDKMSGLVLRSAQKAGIPIRIAHSHNTNSEGGLAAKVYKLYAGSYIRSSATHLLACSKIAASWLFSSRSVEAEILTNGIDCTQFGFSQNIRKEVREELKLQPEQLVIGHVGRFARQKNHTFLIDIFQEVKRQKSDAILILAGDGPLREDIGKKVQSLDLEKNVRFLGIRSDISRLLQAFDVFVFPSLHEGLPVTLVEAQGSGLPCVISKDISQEVDMGAGLISFESLNSSVEIWANHILNANIRIKNVKPFIHEKGYDIQKSANWLEKVYLNAL